MQYGFEINVKAKKNQLSCNNSKFREICTIFKSVRVWKPFSRPQARSGEDDERLAKAGTPDGEAGTPGIFGF